MCEFCEPTKEEITNHTDWLRDSPRDDDRRIIYGEIKYLLNKGYFSIGCKSNNGYLLDFKMLSFKYCPMCGNKL